MKKFLQYCLNNPMIFIPLLLFPAGSIYAWCCIDDVSETLRILMIIAGFALDALIVLMAVNDYTQNPNKARKKQDLI